MGAAIERLQFLGFHEPILITWMNFNPSMDKQLYPLYSVGWNFLYIP